MLNHYLNVLDSGTLYFSGCEGCMNSCCDGSRFAYLPLILEDFEEVYEYFPIVFAYVDRELRALILMSDKSGKCRYFNGYGCVLYDKRPPGCRLYPMTPFYNQLFIDTTCPGVTTQSDHTLLVSSPHINPNFYHHRLKDFEIKRALTSNYMQSLIGSFESIGLFYGLELLKYIGEKDDQYIQMHTISLQHLAT